MENFWIYEIIKEICKDLFENLLDIDINNNINK